MLSIPTPALIANFKFPPASASNTSEVRVVADLITIASKSFNFSPNTSCSKCSLTTYAPNAFKASIDALSNPSFVNTLIILKNPP